MQAVCQASGGLDNAHTRFGSAVLHTTEVATDEAMAGRLAERALEAKVVALFGESAG